MRKLTGAILILSLLALPSSSEAGVRSGLKKGLLKVAHVVENVLYVAVATGVLIVVCKNGGCS